MLNFRLLSDFKSYYRVLKQSPIDIIKHNSCSVQLL
jgi:hypothetical protein